MPEEKEESTSIPLSHPDNTGDDPEDSAKSPPSSSNSSTREVRFYFFRFNRLISIYFHCHCLLDLAFMDLYISPLGSH